MFQREDDLLCVRFYFSIAAIQLLRGLAVEHILPLVVRGLHGEGQNVEAIAARPALIDELLPKNS